MFYVVSYDILHVNCIVMRGRLPHAITLIKGYLPARLSVASAPEFALCRDCKVARRPCMLVRMPELPDITAYLTALEPRIVGQPLVRVRVLSAFLLRTAEPPLAHAEGRGVRELRRIGKR